MRCDGHVHIVGPADRYPQSPARTFLADVAPLDELQRRGAAHGIARFVIVQPSFYGSDNRLLLESLDALGGDGRGVVVIGRLAARELLEDHARRGVRGLRLNLYSSASSDYARPPHETFAALAAVARDMRWHVEVIAPLPVLIRHAELIAQSAVPVIIDHYGVYGDAAPDSADAGRLLDLLRRPHVWMKLSAPYRVSADPLATVPNRHWLDAILAAAAERCVWGSDWPHTPPHAAHRGPDVVVSYRALSYAKVVNDFLAALPSAALADRIMQDNPAWLYEF